jgi:hypothetical protein
LCDHCQVLVLHATRIKGVGCWMESVRHTGLDLAVKSSFEEKREVHLEAKGVLDHFGIDQDLVRNAKVEGTLILVHELAVLL